MSSSEFPRHHKRVRQMTLRSGAAMLPLSEQRVPIVDRVTLEARARGRQYVSSLSIIAPNAEPTPDVAAAVGIGLRLPEHECSHGRLPGDRTPPCGCWDPVLAEALRPSNG